jgi:deoxycytidylate deaminase
MAIIDRLVKAALDVAQISEGSRYKVGASAYRNGRIIGIGCNDPHKTSTQALNRTRKTHAELAMFNNSGRDIKDSTVFVVRLTKNSTAISMARPCKACMSLLIKSGVKRILYTDWYNQIVDESRNRVIHIIEIKHSMEFVIR